MHVHVYDHARRVYKYTSSSNAKKGYAAVHAAEHAFEQVTLGPRTLRTVPLRSVARGPKAAPRPSCRRRVPWSRTTSLGTADLGSACKRRPNELRRYKRLSALRCCPLCICLRLYRRMLRWSRYLLSRTRPCRRLPRSRLLRDLTEMIVYRSIELTFLSNKNNSQVYGPGTRDHETRDEGSSVFARIGSR